MNELKDIQTVKIQGQGYLLNGTMSVPKADGNKEFELIKQWLSEGNTPEPEFTEEEILTQKQNEFRAERNNLLVEADVEINKLVDLGLDSTEWRIYRQELRDLTLTWVLPSKPIGGN